jgi:acetyltransferase-like isoleucine patch superfamily enzyme
MIQKRMSLLIYDIFNRLFSSNTLKGVYISNKKNCKIGKKSILYHDCKILCNFGHFTIGDNSHLGADVYVNCVYGNVTIGDNTAIGPKTIILVYSNHYEHGKLIRETHITKDIVIGDDVFIGAGAIILPGIQIGNGAVIGAGSIVTKNVLPYTIVAGNPAKKIKDRQR